MLTPTHIYSFYLGEYLWHNVPRFSRYMIAEQMKRIRNAYVEDFVELLKRQLEKYIRQRRIEPGIENVEVGGSLAQQASILQKAMAQTFRSDMQRRNEAWNALAEHVAGLANSGDNIRQIIFLIDRINNQIHNAGTLVLGKFSNGRELLRALQRCSAERNPMALADLTDGDIREVAKFYSRDQLGIDLGRRSTGTEG